jgi:NADPH:quinone reductase-like Zn-dependent oxidoreductase
MNKYVRVVISDHGRSDVLRVETQAIPEPQPNEVRVRITAAGVGYSDLMAQHGGYPLAPKPPFTPGYDFTGVIDKVGKNVTGLSEGQCVAALNPEFGSYAEYVCLSSERLVPFSSSLDPAEVCSLILNYLTAHCILHTKARIKPGQRVLVHSAAGGVGSALVQLASLHGVRVLGTASAPKHDLVKAFGATPIDYKSDDFVDVVHSLYENGVDAAFDPIGGQHLFRSYRAVRIGGRVVSYGFAGNNLGGLLPMALGVMQLGLLNLIPDGKRVNLCALPGEVKKNNRWYKATLNELISLYEQGKLKPVIGARVPLAEAAKAHDLLESGRITGKIILACG